MELAPALAARPLEATATDDLRRASFELARAYAHGDGRLLWPPQPELAGDACAAASGGWRRRRHSIEGPLGCAFVWYDIICDLATLRHCMRRWKLRDDLGRGWPSMRVADLRFWHRSLISVSPLSLHSRRRLRLGISVAAHTESFQVRACCRCPPVEASPCCTFEIRAFSSDLKICV